MPQSHRLPRGGRIDRARPLTFSFNGTLIEGYAGDTVASALLANGVKLAGRSFKYHRPRGILTHGSDEPNALLSVSRGPGRVDPNNRATMVEAVPGLRTASQNHWPSLEHDIGAVNDLLSPVFVAGFYYKTFMWPRGFWDKFYEPVIRSAAGLGVAPTEADPDRYVHRHAHCDVLVAGAGPAGLAAARAAAETGARVILADEQPELGGSLLHETTASIDGLPAARWLEEARAELASMPNVTLLPRTTVFGYYNHNHIVLTERVTDHLATPSADLPRERLWQVRAKEVVIATGAHERPLTFADNDRPGIMLAESVRVYINRYGVAPGRRIVFVTSGASAYRAAADAKAAGLDVTLVDVRPDSAIGAERALAAGLRYLTGHTVIGATGTKAVTGLIVAPVSASGGIGTHVTLPCDCVGMSGGWTPSVHLFSQSRGKLAYQPEGDIFVPATSVQNERSVGACNGTFDLAAILAEGWAGGATAAKADTTRSFAAEPATPVGFKPVRVLPTNANPLKVRAFLDFQNDVTAKDVRLAVREGFESVEHVKRYTTTGMATDQGKTSNMTALGLLSETLERPVPQVGTTTFRPPYTPVTFGAIIGSSRNELFDPIRKAPLHEWAQEHGAVFENVALWRRAWFFPRSGEDMHAAVKRECKAVREGVGIFDASTLGKIEVVGPDAAEFLNRIYPNAWLKLEPGRCRYGLMLKEDGFVFDDGVVARVAPDRFHVTTTTGGAARVLAHMEDYLQTEWPDLKVFVTSTSEQWAVIALQGPKAREVLAPFIEGIDLSPEAFPHMAMRTGRILGVPTRLFRVSFTGELGFEINVPTDYARTVWEALYARGAEFGITPYGTETMHVLRAERGFIIVGQDTDGTVTPDDLGLGGMVSKQKPDFVGKRSLTRPDMLLPDRKQLVGLLSEDSRTLLEEGAQIVADVNQPVPMTMLGHVTSSYDSAACGRPIALALVSGGRARINETLHVTTPNGFAAARVVPPVFFDAEGKRVNGTVEAPAHA
ncbi:sarcosine oxidase alpha subunit [Azorhizobium caulinodans ORS 571]|uniref:Sarcosine oxidase alpha subunit n=1 Tax=Azorhizobium caulinodans (strain ATCC 43989 / DSM 5975 / JCM 20966 / LMG 6465 / NBRC 14845 / NCIMB 13405 / ORS 571) TaxID=438753 RepID=A8HRD6_AZOC5|nr:sarcosine oxidase subunit alpha family protein [Azorhizobium caulinodans]BAF87168.1 sarcosine oxidase alpha subunit [Azorhizobium caulinodans ORS 571]